MVVREDLQRGRWYYMTMAIDPAAIIPFWETPIALLDANGIVNLPFIHGWWWFVCNEKFVLGLL